MVKTSGLDALLHRPEQESVWRRLFKSPARVVAQFLYEYFVCRFPSLLTTTTSSHDSVRIVCVSDTHNAQLLLPDGDILIHAGDLTQSGTIKELNMQIEWLDSQPHRYKVVIAGNHELCLDQKFPHATEGKGPIDWKSLIYLQNSSTTLEFGDRRHLKIFGSPYTPRHGNWAFQYPRIDAVIWESIGVPEDTDILVTHGPPKAHLDLGHLGCSFLLGRLWSMKQKPLLHVFGHIHGGYGKEILCWDALQQAYERIMENDSKWANFGKLWYHAAVRILRGNSIGNSSDQQRTIMINAAAVGGLRDEKRREAVCVDV